MKKMNLVFKLVELRKVTNKDNQESIMMKLFCEEFVKSVTKLGDFEQENKGQLTYYMFVKKMPEGYELGEQKEPKEYDIEHYYEGAGVWKPVNYNVIERKISIGIENVKIKLLKSL